MDDLISRQVAIDAADKIIERDTSGNNDVVKAMTAWKMYVKALPSAQPEQHEGHWIPNEGYWIKYDKRFPWRHLYKCSECGNYLDFSGVNAGRGSANFCPNCGAKMKGAKDG